MPRTALEGDARVADQVEKAKKPTQTFQEYAEWLGEHGVTVKPAVAQAVSRLYGEFQKSNVGGPRSRSGAGTVAPKPKPAKAPAKAKPGDASTDPGSSANPKAKRGAAKAAPAGKPRSGRRGASGKTPVEAPY